MLIQIPLPIRTQTLWWYHIRLGICVWCPWLFEQVDVLLNCVTPLLDEDVSRRRRRDTEVMHLLDALDLLQFGGEEVSPVQCWGDNRAILARN